MRRNTWSRNTWALIGLGALAVMAVVLVVLSFIDVRPRAVDAEPATAPNVQPEAEASPSPKARAPRESTVANIQALLAGNGPVKILVLGDATGMDDPANGQIRWVTLWAQDLAEQRPVTVTSMGPGGYGEPVRLGSGTGASIDILNASDFPATLAEAAQQADTLIPDDVDLVLMSFGHREEIGGIQNDLDALWAELPTGSMGVVMAQNPERGAGANGQRARAQAVTSWAKAEQVPSVDVFNAFIVASEPLSDLLWTDRINPNNRGSEVWRDAIVDALD